MEINWKKVDSKVFTEIYKAEIQDYKAMAVYYHGIYSWSVNRDIESLGFGYAQTMEQAKEAAERFMLSQLEKIND